MILQEFIFKPNDLKQGKFIRIHFGTNGKIAGADIETCERNPKWKTIEIKKKKKKKKKFE